MTSFEIIQINGASSFPVLERFPWLQYMPSWVPGCTFKRIANRNWQGYKELKTTLFDIAVNNQVRTFLRTVTFSHTLDSQRTGMGNSLIAELAIKNEGNQEEIEAIQAMGTVSSLGKSLLFTYSKREKLICP